MNSPHEEIPQYPQQRRLGGPQNWSFTEQRRPKFVSLTKIYNGLFVIYFLTALHVDTQRRNIWPVLIIFIIPIPKAAAYYCWYYTSTATTMPQFQPSVGAQLLDHPVSHCYQYSCN